MTKTVAISLTILTFLFTSSCIDGVNDNPSGRNPEKEQRELNEALASLISEGWDIDTTAMGIYYIVHEEGEGPLAQEGDSLSLEYIGYLLGGTIFDASSNHYEDGSWEFVLNANELIPGFVDGISVMNKAAVIDMIIPSQYAYGEKGQGPIEPFTTLLFSAQLHDLKPGP
jgi:FKBP-type peptidyl-prolyl cis-trans isomerase FkpA